MEKQKDLTIIKLGGSLLTDKSTPYQMKSEKFRDIAREIHETLEKVIIIHGVGSLGHPPVKKYGLYKGYTGPENLLNLAKTQSIVFELRIEFVRALQEEGINAMIFLPSSQVIAENMRIKEFFLEPVKKFLEIGMVPVLGGDMVIDERMGFSVCSGDTLAVYLADKLGAKRLIFASDVDGIYTNDPKKDPEARHIPEINLNAVDLIAGITGSNFIDVTKGMAGKIEAIERYRGIIEKGTEVVFLSMLNYGNLKAYLSGNSEAKFTKITVKREK
ncbi:amino acid kinase [Euryarchaeota archaeon ex4484_178]|nr:MAG: amino acid kinase [Euryarchaeota archaeon ex4484_178]